MAIQAIGASSYGSTVSGAAVKPVGKSLGAAAQALSTVVVSKVTIANPDGSTITTITYADGHTETEATPPTFGAAADGKAADGKSGAPVAPAPSGDGNAAGNAAVGASASGLGALVNLLV